MCANGAFGDGSSRVVATLLAHQGGWDEILLVAVPIAIILGLLVVARRRIEQMHREPPDDEVPSDQLSR